MMKQIWNDLGSKLGTGLCGAGVLLVFLGWNGAASVDRIEAQFPYLLSGGIAGLSLVVIGVGLIIVQNQRSDRALLQQTLRELEAAVRGEDPAETDFEPPAPRPTPDVYAVPLQTQTRTQPAARPRRAGRAPLTAEDA
jgi:hypothetical protein